ncbi:FadR family transcriptional regulator [Deinococcus cavernae]|uniref:FadR family transcriptional regulator n=1 Tax=Deinococcus cavernae TaxID=2320857 RepID=A0A418VEJ6_9DEIO|nr:FCD domain-containing protein [Deinococcus cavernae]RJF74531.1 FadR family transcriptional regulator [Deinococcus cavernae]
MNAPATENRVITVVQHIQHLIHQHGLSAGAALPSEVQLSKELGISRGIVREAYRMLAATGAVELRNGRVPRVGGLSTQPLTSMFRHVLDTGQVSPLHVLQFRRAVELQAVGLAALNRTHAQGLALLDTVKEMRQGAEEGQSLTAPDLKFHALLAEASGNPLFQVLTQTFSALIEESMLSGMVHYTDEYHQDAFIEVHQRIAAAVWEQQPARAMQAMQEHYQQAELAVMLSP